MTAILEADLDDPATQARIDAYVSAHPEATPFHRRAWLTAIARGTGNQAHMLIAMRGTDVVGLVPLSHIRSRLFGDALVSTGFAVRGGMLADDIAIADCLAEALIPLAARLRCPTLELRGGACPGAGWTRHDDLHLGFKAPLAADTDAQLAIIPRKHRAEVRKGLGNGQLSVSHGRDTALIRAHYHVYANSVRNLGTPVFPRGLFTAVMDSFGDDAEITLVRDGDRPVSAVLTLYHRGVAMPYWGGGIAEARQLRSNELLYFRLMDRARERGCTAFDFGRSKVNSGQAKWKSSWGFDPVPLMSYTRTLSGKPRNIKPDSAEHSRKVDMWKRLPLPVANIVGPWIARGLG
ncbi:FemAB family XrtA/PEP-CTERM system-associated protein [Sphingobium algorifonticola]|uniref:FemAB family PEP-CTERM system-associated protein n=1 Tax=Sphingobium algorifonticola TaxID=2008318 RepID=A0A437J6R1_9SPHN|nr:FemAB family XrtA/PEP-CTERM system-associated protein [Sphingobium algorifonticola]RVT40686.1 FemAB family PEP-CTERM system-associated protein [Sphingobium algorifonticola]